MTDRFPICFTLDCDNPAQPGRWFCRQCNDLIRQASERDAARGADRKAADVAKRQNGRPRRHATNAKPSGDDRHARRSDAVRGLVCDGGNGGDTWQ